MAKQCAPVQRNSSSFPVTLKTVAFVMRLHVQTTLIAPPASAVAANAPSLAEIKMIAPTENIVRITDAQSNVPATTNAQTAKRVNRDPVQLDAEATTTAAPIYRVTTTIVSIHVKTIFADQMRCAESKIMPPNVNVPLDSKQTQHQNKDAFECLPLVFHPAVAPMDTCASQTFAKYHALNQARVLSENDVITTFAPKFATQTTIVCLAKSVTNGEHVNRAAKRKQTVHQHKFARLVNASAATVSSEHHSDALISTNAQTKCATRAPFARTHPDHSNACAQSELSEILINHPVACCQTNVLAMKTVPETWLASKGNVLNHVQLLNVDATPFVKEMNIKLSASAHKDILGIQLIRRLVASALNVLTTMTAVKTNIATHKSTSVKVSISSLILAVNLRFSRFFFLIY